MRFLAGTQKNVKYLIFALLVIGVGGSLMVFLFTEQIQNRIVELLTEIIADRESFRAKPSNTTTTPVVGQEQGLNTEPKFMPEGFRGPTGPPSIIGPPGPPPNY